MPERYLFLLNCVALAAFAWDTPAQQQPSADLYRATELEQQGQVKEAEDLLHEVIRRAESSDNYLELGVALNNLAVLYAGLERPADAERYFNRAIRLIETLDPSVGTQMLARTKLHLAAVLVESGRMNEAAKLNVTALLGTLQGPDDQARARGTLAAIAMAKNDLATAEQMLIGVLSFWQSRSEGVNGKAEIATALNNLGIIAWRQGRTETAFSRLSQSLQAWRTVVGPENPTIAKAMSNLGSVCMQAKRYDDAANWFQQATGIAQRSMGELHPFTVNIQIAHAKSLKKAGRKSEAGRVEREANEAKKMARRPSVADYTLDYRDVAGAYSGRVKHMP
jgi:tetratricopeptide (TPR) repeat protein